MSKMIPRKSMSGSSQNTEQEIQVGSSSNCANDSPQYYILVRKQKKIEDKRKLMSLEIMDLNIIAER
jgi:hypothetical protein